MLRRLFGGGRQAQQAAQYRPVFTQEGGAIGEYRDALNAQQQTFAQDNQELEQLQGGIDQAFAHREAQASQVADAYRRAGFTNLADQYRQAFKHNSFNMARRGLGGGSADIDSQVRLREDVAGQARGIESNAANMFNNQMMQAGQQQFGLQQAAFQNPFEQGVEQQRIAGITAQTRRLMGIHDAATDARNAQLGGAMQQAQLIQQAIAGTGQAVGTGLAMQGGRM